MMRIRAKLFLVTMLSFPAVALAQVGDVTSDPVSLIAAIGVALQAHHWLAAAPLLVLAAIWVVRVLLRPAIPWVATDQGGAVLGALGAAAGAVSAAAALPGQHSVLSIILVVVPAVLGNTALLRYLKKIGIDLTVDPAPAAIEAQKPPSASPGAAAALLILAGALLLAAPAPARAQVTYSVGPTLPLLQWSPGEPHPVQIAPGAGVQLSLTDARLQRVLAGRTWDLLDLNLMAFGSLVRSDSGQQFGQLSAALGVCTLSSALCLGAGHPLVTSEGAPGGGKWFVLMAFSFNIGLSAPARALAVAHEGAPAALPRGNTFYLAGAP
jgi:hypothetical protein